MGWKHKMAKGGGVDSTMNVKVDIYNDEGWMQDSVQYPVSSTDLNKIKKQLKSFQKEIQDEGLYIDGEFEFDGKTYTFNSGYVEEFSHGGKMKKGGGVSSNWNKLNQIAEDEYGEFGFATLSEEEMSEIIDMKKANKITEKEYGEFGFATLDEDEMEEIINNNPSLILKKDTSRKMALGGMVEDLSYSQIDRMEGLYPNEEMDTFLNTANFIIKDMENEGFEKDEVISFLAYKIVQDTKKKYSTQSIKASEFEPVGSYHDMSSKSWTQEDQNALEGWMSDIRYGYGWITPDYVETSWTGRPGSGTKEWNRDIQKRVFQGLINEELLWTENKNEPGEQGYEITSIEDALKMMAKGGGIPNKYREAIYNMEDWMPDNMQLMDEYNYFLESGDVDGLTSFIEEYGDEETLAERYDITYTEYETLANTAINM